ncbi:MAG: hypothetical protein J6D07_03325 [Mogibacterium sp.]|nr:hypothetical protein [Mogibacterium sp.]
MEDLNSKNRIEIRRHHNQLKVTSNGVMILGVWSILKAFLTTFMGTNQLDIPGAGSRYGMLVSVIAYLIFLAFDLRLRLVIWRGARKEAYGRDTNNRYIVLTIILLMVSAASLTYMLYSLFVSHDQIPTHLASILIESASFVIMCELLYSGFRIRRIRSVLDVHREEAA